MFGLLKLLNNHFLCTVLVAKEIFFLEYTVKNDWTDTNEQSGEHSPVKIALPDIR